MVRAEPRDWPLGVGPALSPRLWSRGGCRLGLNLGPELLSKQHAGAHEKAEVWLKNI